MTTFKDIKNIPINDIGDLRNAAVSLDTAIGTDVFVKNNNSDDLTQSIEHRAIWNTDKNSIAAITSNKYSIIQHRDVVEGVANTLANLGIKIKGELYDFGNIIKGQLSFVDDNNDNLINDDADGIRPGIKFTNSYDKSNSLRLEYYAMRLVCSNGMMLPKILQVETLIHVGQDKQSDEIAAITEKFVKNVIESNSILQEYVNKSIGDTVEWELAVQVFDKLIKSKKHKEAIRAILKASLPEGATTASRWNMYNAITAYATHDEQLSHNINTKLQKAAQSILQTDTKYNKIIEVGIQTE